jgi:uncharacterized protein with von Willebrand factor type A (vWA) domain
MSIKDSIKDRVRDLFKRTKKPDALLESVVQHDRLDDGVLEDIVNSSARFRDVLFNRPEVDLSDLTDEEGNRIELTDAQREKAEEFLAWGDLMKDTFRALHTLDSPELEDPAKVKPSRELNRRIMQQLTASEKFREMRMDTRHDEIASAFTAMGLADGLRESLGEEMRTQIVRVKTMIEHEDVLSGAQQTLEQLRQQVKAQGGKATQEQKEAMHSASQMKTKARQELAEQQAEAQQEGMGTGAIDKIDKALDEAQEHASAMASLPGTGQGASQKLAADEMIDLASKWRKNPELFEMAKMIGRMQRDLRYKRSNRVVGGREEIVDVKTGNDIPLLLPQEKMKLRNPIMRKDFMRRFYEESLVQYETRGYAEAGRGPIIVCIDGSGSMTGMENVWARSLAVSFISIAKREKRDAAAVEFSSTGSVKRWDFMANEAINPLKIIDFASHFFGGGTDITGGVLSAKDLIDKVSNFKTADIVVLTDGQDYWADDDVELRDQLVAQGVNLHGVAIGSATNGYLRELCGEHNVVAAWDLAGTNEATSHLAEAIS